jgi:hypothetical protein
LRQIANPNAHGLQKDLTFIVEQLGPGEFGETMRTISLNGNAEVGRAAFNAAVRVYPTAAQRRGLRSAISAYSDASLILRTEFNTPKRASQ